MSKHRNQTVIIPPDQVTTDEALVIEIPRALRNKPVVIAQARAGIQVKKCCDTTDYSMFLNNLQSSKSAPGIMAAGNYVHSSTQYGGSSFQYGVGQSSCRPQPAAEHSYPHPHAGPTHSQTIRGPDKQCGHLTANIFIQTPNKVTSAMTTSTDSFDNLNKTLVESDGEDDYDYSKKKAKNKQQMVQNVCPSTSDKFFENLVKAIWTNPAPDDCKSHCLKCCGKEQPSQMVVMWDDDSASRPSFDDCKTYCMKCCGITPPNSGIWPIAPTLNKSDSNQPHDCKSHCEKCCTNPSHTRSPIPRVSPSEAEDCQTHCEECCNESRTDPSPPSSYVPESTLMDDCEKFCSIERFELPPCPPRPSRVSCKPSIPTTPPLGHCKIHCSKCCELASGNKAPSGGHFKCIPSSTHCPPKDNSALPGGHFKCLPSSTHCPPKDNAEATPEDEDKSDCCSNYEAQLNSQRSSAPPVTQDKDIVQLYGCESCWSKYSTKTDPCSCSDWEENQRQGDFEFGEPLSKTCEISCSSQIAEINERLDKIYAKIELYEKYFGQADNQEDNQEMCSEYCENQSEPTEITERCEPTCEYQAKPDKPTQKAEAKNVKLAESAAKPPPRAKPQESKQGEEVSKSTRSSMEAASKEKAEADLCQYCCSRSSLKSIPSTCVQRCKAKLQKSEEQIKKETVQAEPLQESPKDVPERQKSPPPQIKPATQQPDNGQTKALSITESKYKKSCKFMDENAKSGDASSKKASEVSACCQCRSKSQTNVLKPIIKTESQQPSQQDAESRRRASQSSLECRHPPSQSSKMCIKCCNEPSQKMTKSQSQVSAPTNYGDTCAKCCKPLSQKESEIARDLVKICYVCEDTDNKCCCVKTSREKRKVELPEMCKNCCSESQKQIKAEPSKVSPKDSKHEPQEFPPEQKRKCTKCNKEYITETSRKIQSDFKEGICDSCCLETILSRLTLRAEPDDGTAPDTSEEIPDERRPSTSDTEGMKVDSSSRLDNETSETDRGDKKTEDKEQQSDLKKEEPKKKRTCFLRRKKSAKGTKNEDNSTKKEK